MPHDLDLGSGHMAYCRASLIDLHLHTKFHLNQRNFLWTEGQISRPALLGRVDLTRRAQTAQTSAEIGAANWQTKLSYYNLPYKSFKNSHIRIWITTKKHGPMNKSSGLWAMHHPSKNLIKIRF